MDLVHVVRHKVLVEGRTQRAVARELGLSRTTVGKYMGQAAPARKAEAAPRPRPVWDAVAERVQAVLADSVRWTGGKQRLTATRLHEMLLAEGKRVGVTVVKEAVAEWKRQRREVFVPLTYRPGDLAEVDFFEVLVDVDGTRRKAWLFLMRLMYSGRDFAWIYERQDQISFLDGHVRAFAHFDGVPARVAYDNLRAAVVRILVGGARTLTPRFAALASHYLLEACFCRPGEGHDKGGVESRGKAIRQQALVPIPVGATLASINATLLAQMDARLDTQRDADRPDHRRALRRGAAPLSTRAHCRSRRRRRRSRRCRRARWCDSRAPSTRCRVAGPDWIWSCASARRRSRSSGATARRFCIRACDLGSGRSTTGITCRSSRASRRRCARCCRISCAISATRFRRSGISCTAAHGPREAARLFAKVLGQLDTYGAAVVVPALTTALASGTPLLLALTPARSSLTPIALDAVPAALRDIDVSSGCAADYDAWLLGGAA